MVLRFVLTCQGCGRSFQLHQHSGLDDCRASKRNERRASKRTERNRGGATVSARKQVHYPDEGAAPPASERDVYKWEIFTTDKARPVLPLLRREVDLCHAALLQPTSITRDSVSRP